jgi:Domain of unknown function (DUF1996)
MRVSAGIRAISARLPWDDVTRRPRIPAALALVLLAALAGTARPAAAGAPEGRVANDDRSFVTLCRFSHRNTDDPIVLPRRPGFSHDHTFVGNVSTDAFSTLDSLHHAKTTCDREQDRAAYWAPTLYDDGKPVDPYGAVVYYRRLTAARVRPYPDGLTVVAGDAHAGTPQSPRIVYWDCGVVKTTLYGTMARDSQPPVASPPAASSTPPSCPPASKLQLHVNFPDCWNGKTIDSVDHKRHMAYSVAGRCPRSHPVSVAALSLVYQYPPVSGMLALSSGGLYSAHADFVNAWDEKTLKQLVNDCLNAGKPCGTGS